MTWCGLSVIPSLQWTGKDCIENCHILFQGSSGLLRHTSVNRSHYTWVSQKVCRKIFVNFRCGGYTADCACWYSHEHSLLLWSIFDLMRKNNVTVHTHIILYCFNTIHSGYFLTRLHSCYLSWNSNLAPPNLKVWHVRLSQSAEVRNRLLGGQTIGERTLISL